MNKLRVWDNELLTDTYSVTSQIQHRIELILNQINNQVEIPHSMVPTKTLYEIVLGFDLMYNLLLDKELISLGHKKQDKSKTH